MQDKNSWKWCSTQGVYTFLEWFQLKISQQIFFLFFEGEGGGFLTTTYFFKLKIMSDYMACLIVEGESICLNIYETNH